jgi:hypothetical protein
MARLAAQNAFTIAPFNDTGVLDYDVVGFRDYNTLNQFYAANYFELSIGIPLLTLLLSQW